MDSEPPSAERASPQDQGKALSTPGYWDERYQRNVTHEWFRNFSDLEGFLQENLLTSPGRQAADNPLVLHLGSGDSSIPAELASRGYTNQLCVDFSPVVVKLMSERHSSIEGISWRQMDVRNMQGIADKSVDVAFDKGTLDAMVHGSPWNPPDDVRENTGRYLKEVYRVLKDDGVFLYVTFRQPHFAKPLLNAEPLWDLDMHTLGGGGSFDYYGFVIKKKRGETG